MKLYDTFDKYRQVEFQTRNDNWCYIRYNDTNEVIEINNHKISVNNNNIIVTGYILNNPSKKSKDRTFILAYFDLSIKKPRKKK